MKLPFWPNPIGYRNIDLELSRVYELLARIDNPHLKLPPTIHIAGTNGKGSTLTFLKNIFEENGYLVHAYTSPHLVDFNERIILSGKKISDEFLNECLLICAKACEKKPEIEPTYFEGITAAAFLAFSKVKADILLLETGMGGRLDATNVIPKNLCSIITPISFDHTEFLGKTITKIAAEKAGIIKENCPIFVGNQKKQALETIKKQAKKLKSEIKIFDIDWKIKKQKNSIFSYEDKKNKFDFSIENMIGNHQVENASLAIFAALSQNQFQIKIENLKNAIKKSFWPARLQKIKEGKFYNQNYDLYLDGSHNLQGSATIKQFLKTQKNKKKILIFSMLKDKNCFGFLKNIRDEIDLLIALEIKDEKKSLTKEEILKIAQLLEIKALEADNFEDAFKKIPQEKNNLILISGSLYLAGNFLEEN